MIPKCLCMIALMLTGATLVYAQQPSNLVGTWVGMLGNYELKLVLNADGSAQQEGMAGTWRAEGNKIYLTMNDDTDILEYHFQDSRLVLSGEGLDSPMTLTRQGGGTAAGRQAPKTNPANVRPAVGSKRGLDQAGIVDLMKGGVPEKRICALVDERGISFILTPAIAKQLQGRGASPSLIEKLKEASVVATGAAEEGCHEITDPSGKTVMPPGCREGVAVVSQPTSKPAMPKGTGIFINEQELTPQEVQELKAAYGGVGQPGRFWYDRMNGSWGRQGGPTEGFIKPGLNLGGLLREDASNGNTGVFFNGRQLHQIDVLRLRQLGPVNQGRYWMDAQGNIGFEGGPALINIWVAAQARQGGGRKEGILSTYDKTGVAVF